jgi:hypothetical protein
MERLILDEQTTPNESFEAGLKFSAGATPGGVTGLGRRVGIVIVGPYYTARTSDGSSAAAFSYYDSCCLLLVGGLLYCCAV